MTVQYVCWHRQHLSSNGSKLDASNGVKKPRVPIANAMTGGSAASARNKDAVCRTVPSPPKVTQKSGISAQACRRCSTCSNAAACRKHDRAIRHRGPTLIATPGIKLRRLALMHFLLHQNLDASLVQPALLPAYAMLADTHGQKKFRMDQGKHQ